MSRPDKRTGNAVAISESAALTPFYATCACKRTHHVAVASSFADTAATLAGRAFLHEGWVYFDSKWVCPTCWARTVAARGPDEQVTAAIQARGNALGIEVR